MAVTDDELLRLATELGKRLTARRWTVATAESCTGGWIAKVLTDVAGSSQWFGSGFVTYSDTAKMEFLDVSPELIEAHGAVSAPVARALAAGARARVGAELTAAVSGIAGPTGGSPEKPVGTVWYAWANPDGIRAETYHYSGTRDDIRRLAVAEALRGLIASIGH